MISIYLAITSRDGDEIQPGLRSDILEPEYDEWTNKWNIRCPSGATRRGFETSDDAVQWALKECEAGGWTTDSTEVLDMVDKMRRRLKRPMVAKLQILKKRHGKNLSRVLNLPFGGESDINIHHWLLGRKDPPPETQEEINSLVDDSKLEHQRMLDELSRS